MRQKSIKQILDAGILLCGTVIIILTFQSIKLRQTAYLIFFVIVITMAKTFYDMVLLCSRKQTEESLEYSLKTNEIEKLVLLDEMERPIRSWDMQGKVSMIIGRAGHNQELDIDLSDCEYSSFIDFHHAVLNFSLDEWYVEDLGSQNGVKVKKAKNGECYKVIQRPCKLEAGDILYIANTKLLLT